MLCKSHFQGIFPAPKNVEVVCAGKARTNNLNIFDMRPQVAHMKEGRQDFYLEFIEQTC